MWSVKSSARHVPFPSAKDTALALHGWAGIASERISDPSGEEGTARTGRPTVTVQGGDSAG